MGSYSRWPRSTQTPISLRSIVAVDGDDAAYGLPGIHGDFSPRRYKQLFFNFSTNVKVVAAPEKEVFYRPPVWHTRAWTFQKRAVSPRNLIFSDNTVYWQFRDATWAENLAAEPDGVVSANPLGGAPSRWPAYALRNSPWPDIKQYFELVGGFSNRNLTFESDALNAFTAITTAMGSSFDSGFLFGIPEFLFDLGLLWSRESYLKRRECFPSWSGLGWSGRTGLPTRFGDAWNPLFQYFVVNVGVRPLVECAKCTGVMDRISRLTTRITGIN